MISNFALIDSNNNKKIYSGYRDALLYSQDPTNKANQSIKKSNDNDSGNDNINNKKIPHKPHNHVLSFLGYKHSPTWESIQSLEDLNMLEDS